MIEILNSIFFYNTGSPLVLISSIANIVFGVVLFFVGLSFRKKEKSWWKIVSLVGVVGILTNVIILIY
ncbi:hypothetical protein [Bacillus solimangrovi]|uniref:Uncharacterized protein n=1 Tax=Bacillus solimangrovi TaxID=1305675 RepID=A0A1E5LD84_9BACI|nr:hypothetical protein [Bacillus solimangrovi]OEH92020.1 hypothetical protein BFG57_17295 [Bacillus solimangrovi]